MEKEKTYLNKKEVKISNEELDNLNAEVSRLTEEILVLRNSRIVSSNNSKISNGRKAYPLLGGDLFGIAEVFDLLKLIQILKQYMLNKWEYENSSYNFVVKMETLLFELGTCIVFPAPDGEYYPVNYSYDPKDLDYYGEPKKVVIVSDNALNGKVLTKGNFVILKNNSMRVNTLYGLYDRISSYVRSLVDVDNVGFLSRPKWFIGDIDNPTQAAEMEQAYANDNVFVSGLNFKAEAIELNNSDKSKTYQEIFMFNMNMILKFLGISVEDLIDKKAQQNVEEIKKQQNFENEVQKDFLNARLENIRLMNGIGYNISFKEPEEEEMTQDIEEDITTPEVPKKVKKGIFKRKEKNND